MFKMFSMVATAALIAGAVTVLPALSPNVAADTPKAMVKADRLETVKTYGSTCSQRAWPYYEADCLRTGGESQPRQVRLVTTDQLPNTTIAIKRAN